MVFSCLVTVLSLTSRCSEQAANVTGGRQVTNFSNQYAVDVDISPHCHEVDKLHLSLEHMLKERLPALIISNVLRKRTMFIYRNFAPVSEQTMPDRDETGLDEPFTFFLRNNPKPPRSPVRRLEAHDRVWDDPYHIRSTLNDLLPLQRLHRSRHLNW